MSGSPRTGRSAGPDPLAGADPLPSSGSAGKGVEHLIDGARVIICCGPGGVGKTTIAAALGLAGAQMGRRCCVVTIDPAKRLADALGLSELGNEPSSLDLEGVSASGGELWATMLDTKGTFDDLVRRYSKDPDQVDSILQNRLYKNVSGALSGTQEYMAMEKLYELNADDRFDLVVVDTPPTRNALDFLDAPHRLARFLENRVFRLLTMPTRAYLKAVSLATRTLLKTVARVVGSEVVGDTVAFFQAFEGMEEGFRNRAHKVESLLSDPATSFVVVSSPTASAVEEAVFFIEKLAESDMSADALVVNRVHPLFDPVDARDCSELEGLADRASTGSEELSQDLVELLENWSEMRRVALAEEGHLSKVSEAVGAAPIWKVPLLDDDVHDLAGILEVAARLTRNPTDEIG